jgi:hypothetical protein
MNFLQNLSGIVRRAAQRRGATVGASDGESSQPVTRRAPWHAVRREAHGAEGVCHVQAETILFEQETFAGVGKGRGLDCCTRICHCRARATSTDCLAQQSGNSGPAKPVWDRCGRRGLVRARDTGGIPFAGVGIAAGVFSEPVCATARRGRAAARDVLSARPYFRPSRARRRPGTFPIWDLRCTHEASVCDGRRKRDRTRQALKVGVESIRPPMPKAARRQSWFCAVADIGALVEDDSPLARRFPSPDRGEGREQLAVGIAHRARAQCKLA